MAKATTTTYLEIESIGADKLITTMAGLQKSMNFVAGMLKDLNKGLGISSAKAKEGADAIDAQGKAAAAAAQSLTQLKLATAAQNSAIADITANVNKLAKANNDAKKKGIDWTALKSKIDLAKQAYSAIKNTFLGLSQEALKMAQAWQVQEQAENKLQAALERNMIGGAIEDYKEWAKTVQAATVYGDEYTLTLAAQAAKFARTGEDTKRATQAALDYASATGGDATTALTAMGRALSGNARSLQSLGIYLDDTEQKRYKEATQAEKMAFLLAKLEAQYGGFAEALATTPTAALTQAQNLLGDIYEEVGKLVSPALYAGLSVVKDILTEQLDALGLITGDAKTLKSLQDAIIGGLGAAMATLIDIKTLLVVIKNAAEAAVGVFLAAMTSGLKPIGEAVQLLAKLPGLGDSARATFKSLGEAITMPFDASVEGIKSDVREAQKAIAEGERLKDKLWAGIEAGAQKYREAAGKRIGPSGQDQLLPTLAKTKKEREAETLSFTMQLDRETAAFLSAESKRIEIIKEFAEKRMALEQSTLIDYQSKLDYKKELDKQEQEQLRAIKLQYAQETGDRLTLIEDQYRQERMAKETEAAKALEAEQTAVMTKLADNLKGVSNLGLDMLTGWIEGTGDWRAQLYDALKSFSKNLMTTAIASIIDQALVNQAKAQGSQAGIPIVGPILALAAGATMFAVTMALKSKLKPAEVKYASGGYISAGMVRGGVFGRDSVPALLEPGERVLSKKETEAYDAGQSRAVVQNITINVSGQLSTPAQITDTVRRVLVPELKAAARAGYAI